MVLELMDKLSKIFFKYKSTIFIPLFFMLLLTLTFWLYEVHHRYFITAKFYKSGPLYTNMPVYYKGYKIGQVKKIKLNQDYKYTLVKIVLFPKNPKLSEDIVAKAKKIDANKYYIDLIAPDQPSVTLLKNGSIIYGEPAFDLEAFLSDIADSGLIVPLLQNFSDVLVSANKTSNEIRNFFSDSRLILKDNRQNLKQTSKELVQTSKSLTKITSKFNNSITEDKIDNTTSSVVKSSTNILAATESIKNITGSIDCATRNLDKTVAKIDSTVSDTKIITSNVKTITNGFCEVLGKRFAGLRILFGKSINTKKCNNRIN